MNERALRDMFKIGGLGDILRKLFWAYFMVHGLFNQFAFHLLGLTEPVIWVPPWFGLQPVFGFIEGGFLMKPELDSWLLALVIALVIANVDKFSKADIAPLISRTGYVILVMVLWFYKPVW